MRRSIERASVSVALVLAVHLLPVSTSRAGSPHTRDGWMLGLSVGGGPGKFKTSTGEDSSTEGGTVVDVRVGRMVSSKVLISGELDAWTRTEGNLDFWFFNFAGCATLYPGNPDTGSGGFYVRGGLGFASVDVDETQGNTTVTYSEDGFGVLAGLGYELRLTRKFALGAGMGINYLFINGDVFDTAQFVPIVADLNWYF